MNAIRTAQNADYAADTRWERNHYLLYGGDGREAVITFAGGHWYEDAPLVGLFHEVHSDRYQRDDDPDLESFFTGCPPYQRSLAEQYGLRWLRDERRGKLPHRVTAACWDSGDHVVSADPWDLVLANGGSLLEQELTADREEVFSRLRTSMTPEQIALARKLFEKKMSRPAAAIELTMQEVDFLKSTFADPKARYRELERLQSQSQEPGPARKAVGGESPRWWEAIDSAARAREAIQASCELFAGMDILFPAGSLPERTGERQ